MTQNAYHVAVNMDNNTEILIPIWVLKEKVEADHEAWQMFNQPEVITNYSKLYDIVTIEEEEVESIAFPELDSTRTMLEVLESHNIHFNCVTGEWT